MRSYSLLQVDAFTDRPRYGNPCAVVMDTDDLDHTTMQAIALEMNLSETAFVRRSDKADFGVRYFTPAEEIPLAGHPTLAVSRALIDTGRISLKGDRAVITLELIEGPITVEIFSVQGIVENIMMTQRPPQFLNTYDPEKILSVFGLSPEQAMDGVPIQTVSTGTPQLMIPLRDLDALRQAELDFDAYRQLHGSSDFFSPHLFCLGGFTDKGLTAARHFGIPPDLIEDPFTGSATGGMGAYLCRYGLIDSTDFVAEQGHWMNRPGSAKVEVVGGPNEIESVRVGGRAVTVVEGKIHVP